MKLQGTGTSTDEQAAEAGAVTAKNLNVFAVLGGPSQTKSFSQTLANEGILCIGSCEIAQPGSFYKENSPYIWAGIEPDQTSQINVQFVKNQLEGKGTIYAGDPKFQKEKRTFAVPELRHTPDGQYTAVWDQWIKELKGGGRRREGSRQLLPQPAHGPGRRADHRAEAEGDRRDHRDLHR